MNHELTPFFSPKGVALIGTSASPTKLSFGIIRNLVEGTYKGEIYPVNPRYPEILGHTCYPEISQVPDPLELAVIALPAPAIPETIEACGKRGLKAAVIISGGFREVGLEGIALENECLRISRQYGMRLIGPNCVGTFDLYSGLNTTFIKGIPAQGHIGFLSQSGAICGAVVDYVLNTGIGFSNFASLGNMADVNETDVIEYLATDANTKVIAAYLEGIQDGRRFMEVAVRVSREKPIVILKVGKSPAGARAVSSHTGSLAGSHSAYQAAFIQSGVLEVNSAAELFDVAVALAYQPLPSGNRTAVITNSGGPAALASDSLAANGMRLADIKPETQIILRTKLNPSAQVANPIDMLGGAEPPEYAFAMETCLADPGIDAVLAILTPQALVNPADVGRAIGEASRKTSKTVVSCIMGGASIGEATHVLHKYQVPMYVFPEQAGSVLGTLYRYRQMQSLSPEFTILVEDVDRKAAQNALENAGDGTILGEAQTRPLLQAYGIPVVPGQIVTSPEEAARVANKIGTPVAIKIVSPDLLHKSDAGGIRLNLFGTENIQHAYQEMMETIQAHHPEARLEGMLVEKMAPKGLEVIVGMRRDPTFGPLVMFGLGGIYVELFNDVSFRVAPVTHQQALDMIHQTKAGKLLAGLRGQGPADIEGVVDCIQRLGSLALDFPEIEEVEINPLLVFAEGNGVLALDARAIRSIK